MHLKKTAFAMVMMSSLMAAPVMADKDWQGEAKDAWLDGKLETALLLNTQLNNFKIDTDIDNGVANISGTVSNQTQKDLAGEIAGNIEGIKQVNNNITVEENYQGEMNEGDKSFTRTWHDMTVTAGLKMQLAAHDELKATEIEVSTDNGVVTLNGNVKNAAERDLAIEMAKGYDKVESVNDQLVVAN